jgi:SusD/RagB-like outer membrane lipoprotein
VYRGVAKVMEALTMLWGADTWGDLPYTQAITEEAEPVFDTQQSIYTALLALLDGAITDLGGAGAGPGEFDLIYGGDKQKWIRVAHTLKARIHLHLAERLGAAEYTAARTEALAGLASTADDFKSLHTSATSERNMWAQFQTTSFGPDLVAGSTLVNIMIAQADPRLPEYFGRNELGGFGGYDVTTQATPPNQISPIVGSGRTDDDTFSQPLITYYENQLILAETNFRITGAAAAAPFLNTVRAAFSKGPIAAPTLNDIMTEKYILLYQNVEVWNDWKRTCLPARSPARNQTVIPGRVFYGETEEQTNANTPPSTAQSLSSVRNWNDPNAC